MDKQKSGVMLLEWLLSLGVAGICFSVAVAGIHSLTQQALMPLVGQEIVSFCYQQREAAGAIHDRVVITTSAHQLVAAAVRTHQTLAVLSVPEQIVLSGSPISFTPVGTTSQAGTIRLSSGNDQARVTLGVGYGKITWYP